MQMFLLNTVMRIAENIDEVIEIYDDNDIKIKI